MNIKRLMDLGCYRGIRHRRGLPLRGQRTRTNARTRKGPRRRRSSNQELGMAEPPSTAAARSDRSTGSGRSRRRHRARRCGSTKVAKKSSGRFSTPSRTSTRRSTTRSSASRIVRGTRLAGPPRATAASRARARARRSPRRSRPSAPATPAKEYGREEPRGPRQRPGPRARVRGACAERRRFPDHADRGRHPIPTTAAVRRRSGESRRNEVMARYRGPTCKLARREGTDLFLKSGVKPLESKCKLEVPPGGAGQRRRALSDYGVQLREKRSCAACTACSSGSSATTTRRPSKVKGSTGENLLRMLEARLDNVVYRMGFASTRAEARQLVGHRGITVNEQIVQHPVVPAEGRRQDRGCATREGAAAHQVRAVDREPSRLPGVGRGRRSEKCMARCKAPAGARRDISPDINENLVVELYSSNARTPLDGSISKRNSCMAASRQGPTARHQPRARHGRAVRARLRSHARQRAAARAASSMPGAAVVEAEIDGVLHEYTSIEGVQEDVVDILLELEVGRASACTRAKRPSCALSKKGPGPVRAGDIVDRPRRRDREPRPRDREPHVAPARSARS